jgi:hypothetical protein
MATPAPVSRSHTFTVLPHEDQQEFNQLLATLTAQNSPANAHQEFLVRQLATSQWLIARAQRLETKALEQLAGFPSNPDEPDSRLVSKMFETNPKTLATLQHQIQQAERSYYRAWRELKADKKLTSKSEFDRRFEDIQKNAARLSRNQKILDHVFFDPPSHSESPDHVPWPDSAAYPPTEHSAPSVLLR